MANKHLIQEMDDTPPQICFADFATDFSPTAANDLRKGTDTQVQLITASVADAGARQSTKFDFGANRAPAYQVRIAAEMAATPTSGEVIEIYLAPSSSATAATGNPGGVSGSDAAYTGTAADTLAASVKQLQGPVTLVMTDDITTTVQIIEGQLFYPTERYASLIVKNESGAAFHSDDVETHIVLDPIIPESQ